MEYNINAKIVDIQNAHGLVEDLEQVLEKYGILAAELELCLDGNTFAYNYEAEAS